MITRLVCQNFRTLDSLELPLSPLTTLVGPNGAGKSTVLRALDFLLGERWPSLSQLDIPLDFTGCDNTTELAIQAWFEPPLSYDDVQGTAHAVGAIEFRCAPYKKRTGSKLPGDLRDIARPLKPDGTQMMVCTKRPQRNSPPVFGPVISLSSDLREQARVLSVMENRSVGSHLPSRRGSIMARLLSEARASFLRDSTGERSQFKVDYSKAMDALRTEQLQGMVTGQLVS